MKNNKGFTLVEILVTIALIGIILVIAVPSSIKFINRGKEQQYKILENQILSAASKYYVKHKDTKCIELINLVNDIDDKFTNGSNIIDPITKQTLTKKVKVTITGNNIKYELVENCN